MEWPRCHGIYRNLEDDWWYARGLFDARGILVESVSDCADGISTREYMVILAVGEPSPPPSSPPPQTCWREVQPNFYVSYPSINAAGGHFYGSYSWTNIPVNGNQVVVDTPPCSDNGVIDTSNCGYTHPGGPSSMWLSTSGCQIQTTFLDITLDGYTFDGVNSKGFLCGALPSRTRNKQHFTHLPLILPGSVGRVGQRHVQRL